MRFPASILFRRLTIFAPFAWFILAGPGCAPRVRPAATTAVPIRPKIVGEVAVVDEEKKFVLIDLDSNLYVPSPGTKLQTRNAAGETAHLQASPEQKRPFVAADIIDGDPAVGDQVVR